MIPVLTAAGRTVLAVAGAFAVCGAFLGSWTLVGIGCGVLLALLWFYVATLPIPRVLRKERLEFAWWIPHGPGGVVTPRVPFPVVCYLANRTSASFRSARIEVFRSDSLDVAGAEDLSVAVPAGQRVEFRLEATARAAGRAFLHGLALTLEGPLGLCRVHVYFPSSVSVKVFPRAAASRRAPLGPPVGAAEDRAGGHFVRQRGTGAEIREIREHRSGDPFKAIAWKATARAGKLMVRELESEIQARRYAIVDVSSTMRGGDPGARKLDAAIEVAASTLRVAAEANDRFGLVTFDTRVVTHLALAEGRPALLRAFDALVNATAVVDEDLTEAGTPEVVVAVAEYVRHQEGLDFRIRDEGGRRVYDLSGLARHAQRAALREPHGFEVVASDPAIAALRRFCRVKGIVLAPRGDPAFGQKDGGLLEALRAVAAHAGPAATVVLVSDLEALERWDVALAELRRMRARGQRVTCVVPFAPLFADAPRGPAEEKVHALFGREEERRVERIEARLASVGVAVVRMSPRDVPALVFARTALRRAS
jgi:uncharacterized protein (DUF58 family)